MFKKKEKKGSLILHDDLHDPTDNLMTSTNQSTSTLHKESPAKLQTASKKITKKKVRGIEAFPKKFDERSGYPDGNEKGDMLGFIDKEFSRQSGQSEIKDKNLEKFLEENLKKENLSTILNDENKKNRDTTNSILSELQTEIKQMTVVNQLNQKIKDEANNQTSWQTGLVEIQLPRDEKIKNIEEAEAAKRKKLIHELVLKDVKPEIKIQENKKAIKKSK